MLMKKLNIRSIYIVGDVNLQQYKFLMLLDLKKIKNSDIIVIGNFGIGVLNKDIEYNKLLNINKNLKLNNNKIFLLNGYKDNFNKCKEKFSNIKLMKNYDIINLNGKNFLFLDGSIDYFRSLSFSYKRNKPKIIYEYNIPKKNIDIVISIENVDFIYPYNYLNLKPYKKIDKWLYNDIKKNRERLSKIYNNLNKNNITHWFSSRYDVNKNEFINNINFVQLKKLNIIKL
jgi:hypothetical protein